MSGVLAIPTQELLSAPAGGGGGGGGAGSVAIGPHTVTKIGNGTSTIAATIYYNSAGTTTSHTGATLETWLVSGAASAYEIRATFQSGDGPPTTGTMDTWLGLGSNRLWSVTVAAGLLFTSTFLIEIRNATSLVVLDSASIILDAENGV